MKPPTETEPAKAKKKEKPSDIASKRPGKPTRREGGVMANPEQWAARQHRIGGAA